MKSSFFKTLFLVLLIQFVKSENTTLLIQGFNCAEESRLRQNRTEQLLCCNSTVNNFETSWFEGADFLSTYLSTLKALNCPQFEQECQEQTFAVSRFTTLVYLKFCNRSELETACIDDLRRIARDSESSSWEEVTRQLDFAAATDEELRDPCLQIAMLDSASSSQNSFHEVIDALIPFCAITWCGFNNDVINSRAVSVWTCISSR